MRKQIRIPLQLERSAEIKSGPTAQCAQKCLQGDQEHEADAQRQQQITVEGRHHLVHCELQEQRADDGEQLQSGGENEDLSEGALETHDASDQVLQAERPALVAGNKTGRGRELQRNAGKVAAGFGMADPARAHGRIVQENVFPRDLPEHHKMVHLPVQNARGFQVPEVLKLHPQRTRGEIKAAGKLNDVG